MINVGDKLRKKYSDMICTVESVHLDHMMVRFDETGLPWMIHVAQYKNFTKIEEN